MTRYLIISISFFLTFTGLTASAAKPHEQWIDVLSVSQSATRSANFKKTNPKKLEKLPQAKQHKREIATIKQTRKLVKQMARTKDATPKQVKKYNRQAAKLEQQLGSFVSNFPGAEGPASCMMDCDSAYPGIGGGNGVNRVLCKAACIAIAVGGNNPD